MGKILFWIIVILVALVAARMIARSNARNDDQTSQPARSRKKAPPLQDGQEAMVRCEHCGIHLPRSEAMLSGGHTWCSEEHAKLGIKQRS